MFWAQITNAPRSSGRDILELHEYVRDCVRRINSRFGTVSYEPVSGELQPRV